MWVPDDTTPAVNVTWLAQGLEKNKKNKDKAYLGSIGNSQISLDVNVAYCMALRCTLPSHDNWLQQPPQKGDLVNLEN